MDKKWRPRRERGRTLFPPHQLTGIIEYQVRPPLQNRFFLQENYVKKGLSVAQIADLTFSSKTGVRNALKRAGIQIREAHKSHGRSAQLPFGKRLWGGRVKDNPVEQKIISAILNFKEKGMGVRDIARTLNNLGIPTKCQAKSWHPEMVRRILKAIAKQ